MRENKLMKKFLSCFFLILCSIVCFACSKDAVVSCSFDKLSVNMGETYTIKEEDISVEKSKSDYEIVILDTTIATIKDKTIIPQKQGNTTIRIRLKKDKGIYCDIPLEITNNVYATRAKIDKENVQINIHKNPNAINKIALNQGCNEVPELTYNSNIISYNYITGVITAKAVGSTNVVVLYKYCNVSFKVNVVNVVYTKKIEVSDHVLYEGAKGVFDFRVFPDTANTFEFFSNDSNIIEVGSDGSFDAKTPGETTITIKYKTDANSNDVIKTFKVKILERASDFEAVVSCVDGKNSQYYLKENKYRLEITSIYTVTADMLTFSNNILVDKIEVGGTSTLIDFFFLETGRTIIDIGIVLDKYSTLKKAITLDVNSYEDIQVKAKWFIYDQLVYDDGKYHIYLNGGSNLADSLKLSLVLDSNVIDENYKIYKIVNGVKDLCLDTATSGNKQYLFEPTVPGEVGFEFVIGDAIIDTIIVVVDYSL
jgi:hypothetical protein